MKMILAALACAFALLLSSTSHAASFSCEGTVRALVALSNRQIWTNVPYRVEKPIVAATKPDATKAAIEIAKSFVRARETTVAVESASMSCVELPDKPKAEPKPLTTISPVKISYGWVCWVKTTWHLGSKSGKIEKTGIRVDTENPEAKGIAMGLAIVQVQERAKVLLFAKNTKPTWSHTEVDCEH